MITAATMIMMGVELPRWIRQCHLNSCASFWRQPFSLLHVIHQKCCRRSPLQHNGGIQIFITLKLFFFSTKNIISPQSSQTVNQNVHQSCSVCLRSNINSCTERQRLAPAPAASKRDEFLQALFCNCSGAPLKLKSEFGILNCNRVKKVRIFKCRLEIMGRKFKVLRWVSWPFKVSAARASAGTGGGIDEEATSVCMYVGEIGI